MISIIKSSSRISIKTLSNLINQNELITKNTIINLVKNNKISAKVDDIDNIIILESPNLKHMLYEKTINNSNKFITNSYNKLIK